MPVESQKPATPPAPPPAHSAAAGSGDKPDVPPVSLAQQGVLAAALATDGMAEDVGFDPLKLAPVTPKSTEKSLHRMVAGKSGKALRAAVGSGEFTRANLNMPMFGAEALSTHRKDVDYLIIC